MEPEKRVREALWGLDGGHEAMAVKEPGSESPPPRPDNASATALPLLTYRQINLRWSLQLGYLNTL